MTTGKSTVITGGTVVGDAFLAGGGSINFGNTETFDLYIGRDGAAPD